MVLVTAFTVVLCRCLGGVRLMECILLSPDRAVQLHSSPFLVELHLCCSLMSAEAFMPTDLSISFVSTGHHVVSQTGFFLMDKGF